MLKTRRNEEPPSPRHKIRNCRMKYGVHCINSVISPGRMSFSLCQPSYIPTSCKFQPIVAC